MQKTAEHMDFCKVKRSLFYVEQLNDEKWTRNTLLKMSPQTSAVRHCLPADRRIVALVVLFLVLKEKQASQLTKFAV